MTHVLQSDDGSGPLELMHERSEAPLATIRRQISFVRKVPKADIDPVIRNVYILAADPIV
jgi:hypothetical protein